MSRPALEIADIFRAHGPAWRKANAGHLSLGQLKVMSAIERCRTAALGGHLARCEDCAHTQIAYNSCRNRHCPKCQAAAAKEWLAARQAELLPVSYCHVVFTLPAQVADIAYHNKAEIYGILFKASAETLTTIAADPKHLGARTRPKTTPSSSLPRTSAATSPRRDERSRPGSPAKPSVVGVKRPVMSSEQTHTNVMAVTFGRGTNDHMSISRDNKLTRAEED